MLWRFKIMHSEYRLRIGVISLTERLPLRRAHGERTTNASCLSKRVTVHLELGGIQTAAVSQDFSLESLFIIMIFKPAVPVS